MNKLTLVAILLGSRLVLAADAPGFKVAYVDINKAIQSVEEGKQAKASLEKEFNTKKAQIEKREKELKKEKDEFDKQAAIMNEKVRAEKGEALQRKIMEFQKELYDSQMGIAKKERESAMPIIEKLKTVVAGIGKEKGYNLILDKNEGGILFAEGGADLTDDVIKTFNNKYKGKKGE